MNRLQIECGTWEKLCIKDKRKSYKLLNTRTDATYIIVCKYIKEVDSLIGTSYVCEILKRMNWM